MSLARELEHEKIRIFAEKSTAVFGLARRFFEEGFRKPLCLLDLACGRVFWTAGPKVEEVGRVQGSATNHDDMMPDDRWPMVSVSSVLNELRLPLVAEPPRYKNLIL